jgi:hypothetical protein
MKTFNKIIASMMFVICSNFVFGQDFKTTIKMIDSSNASINARLFFTDINKTSLENVLSKMHDVNLFTITDEFFQEKKAANVMLTSKNKFSLKDFESFLKQLVIYTVVYKNQTISSQELASNYIHYKKDEIKKIDRIKQ